jgi:hypothetical protein
LKLIAIVRENNVATHGSNGKETEVKELCGDVGIIVELMNFPE